MFAYNTHLNTAFSLPQHSLVTLILGTLGLFYSPIPHVSKRPNLTLNPTKIHCLVFGVGIKKRIKFYETTQEISWISVTELKWQISVDDIVSPGRLQCLGVGLSIWFFDNEWEYVKFFLLTHKIKTGKLTILSVIHMSSSCMAFFSL